MKRGFIIANTISESSGGGIQLSAVTNINIQVASGKVYVKWTDPDDFVVADTTLAVWNGTLLVRKAGSVPTSRRDGTVVLDSTTRNQYADTYFCDSGLTVGVTYYYKFFPYTTTKAYTDSVDNEFSATPTVQVNGIDAFRVTSISLQNNIIDSTVVATWNDPAESIVSDGITLATWDSTTVVVKAGSIPTGKDDPDAVFVLKSTTRNQYANDGLVVEGLENATTYYFRFFTETTDGGVNESTSQVNEVRTDFPYEVLDENTWSMIRRVSEAGAAANYWSIGDCKAVTVSGTVGTLTVNGTYYAYILGFDHNGATNTIDFGTFKTVTMGNTDVCLVDGNYGNQVDTAGAFTMYTTQTTHGGWMDSHMRRRVLGSDSSPTNPTANTLLAAFPNDLRLAMKQMSVYTDNVGNGIDTADNVTNTLDYLPLLSEFEVFGHRTRANSAEQNYQKQYQYYSAGNSRTKNRHNNLTSTCGWWLRSCVATTTNQFGVVYMGGSNYFSLFDFSYGVAPIFRI